MHSPGLHLLAYVETYSEELRHRPVGMVDDQAAVHHFEEEEFRFLHLGQASGDLVEHVLADALEALH